jgi:transposase
LELYQSTTLPYQGRLAQIKRLFMEFTDDPCEGILPSHAVQYIIENAPKLQSLAVGYTTTGSLLPRGLGDEFVHRSLDHLQISPHDLGTTLSAFEHSLSAPKVSRVTLLELPPSNPELAAKWSRFATNIDASTVTRLDVDIIATHGADDSWRALLVPFVGVQHLVVHPTASMAAILRAMLPVAPYEWSKRLLPRVSHIEVTSPDADAFEAIRRIVHDRLQLTKAGAAWISAIMQVDIYDYNSGAFSSLEWMQLSGLLVEARGYSR